MNSTLSELAQSTLCTLAFSVFLIGPGYLGARAILPFRMRRISAVERWLWSLVLSVPIALLLAETLGRFLQPIMVLLTFVLLTAFAGTLSWTAAGKRRASNSLGVLSKPQQRATHFVAILSFSLAIYILLALLDVQLGHRLFVATVLPDWAVRVPLLASAIHGHVPPGNPLSGLGNTAAPLRYYYFWYVLCAQPARWLHLPARAALVASCVWAAMALLAVLFLCLKYLVGVTQNLRGRCLLVFPLLLVIGLDILPTLAILLHKGSHLHFDEEWWHNDRTPGFLTTILYAPHHVAGLVCCLSAFLLFVLASRNGQGELPSRSTTLGTTVLAGVSFAACVGTSTFLALIFTVVCLLWAIDLLRTRQFRQIASLAGVGLIAWLFSRPYLAELRSGSSAAQGFAGFAWRSSAFASTIMTPHHVFARHPFTAVFVRQFVILALDFAELGFFAFVFFQRFRCELLPALRSRRQISTGQRALWIILFGASLPALFLSSSVTQSANDLGMHAGLVVRAVLLLWSVPFIAEFWQQRRARSPLPLLPRLFRLATAICFLLGLAGGVFNIVLNRFYLPAVEAGLVNRKMDALTSDRLSYRLFAIRSAWSRLGAELPLSARVQFNPTGTMQPAFAIYSNRQIVAYDSVCGTLFGGDNTLCGPVSRELHALYASAPEPVNDKGMIVFPSVNDVAKPEDFARVCRDLSLSAIMVESTDHAWAQARSWVWTMTPDIAEPSVRVFRCPLS